MLDSGLPSHGLQVLTGDVAVGNVLVTHDETRVVWFTGGTATGEAIARAAGLKRLVMELGANSPVIVCADADLQLAVAEVTRGAFGTRGRTAWACNGSMSRVASTKHSLRRWYSRVDHSHG